MPIVIILDTSLSMLRRPFSDANFTYFSVAQTLIESFVGYIRRHHFTELMALVTSSSKPQVRAAFSRREGYRVLLEEVMSVGVEDKADYARAISVAHNEALSAFGATGVPINIILFTDEGALLNGIPEVPEKMEDGKIVEGLPFRFPGNLYIYSIQGTSIPPKYHTPYERLVELNGGRGEVVRHVCSSTLSECVDSSNWSRLFPVQYGELRCGWLRADVQAHPPIPNTPSLRFLVRVGGFVSPEDVSSPAVTTRHLLLPVIPKSAVHNENGVNSTSNGTDVKKEYETELWYPCGTTEDDWKAPQFTALLHGSLASRHMLALAELLPLATSLNDPTPEMPPTRRFALLHSELASPTAAKRSNLTISILMPGVDAIPWMGQLTYLAPFADFDRTPSGNIFPVKTLEPRSYAIGSGHVCWLWGNMALDVSKVIKHARRLVAVDASNNSLNRVNAFYTDVNRVRGAALAFGASSLLISLKSMLEREASSVQDANIRRHIKHVVDHMMMPYDRLKRIEPPESNKT